MGEFLRVVTYEEALNKIKANFPLCKQEKISLDRAGKCVLAQDIISPEDLPAFSRSTVDGYAVKAEDTFGSSESIPAFLDYIGEIKMGCKPDKDINMGQCVWIPTGGMLPDYADAVVMVEYTEKLAENTVLVHKPVGPFENVMQKGEDIKRGQKIFSTGQVLRPQDIGFLASLGVSEVEVFVPYAIGIISTGDEIVPVYDRPDIGQVRDVNSYSINAAVKACGCIAANYPIVKDNFAELKKYIQIALEENDVVLISGGSSVGVMDVTLDVLMDFPGAELLFHGIAVKPGKPTMAVKIGEKIVIGLPGHPVSAMMIFNVICRPVLSKGKLVSVDAKLSVNIASQAGRDDFIPIKLDKDNGEQIATPLLGKSGLMSTLAMADAYIQIPYEQQGLKKGDIIKAMLF